MADGDPKELAQAARRYWADEGYDTGGLIREVDRKDALRPMNPAFAGIKIVDCDTHISEPPDLFTSRAPAKLKDKVPRIRRVDGADRWFVGDRNFGRTGGNVIRADHNKLLGRLGFQTLEEGHPGASYTKDRLQWMDEVGIYAQICYQNSGVTQAGSLMSLGDNELAVAIIQMFNDAAYEREAESGQRLFSLALLPIWDKAAMEAEARRCIDRKLKGFIVPDTPERLGLPSFLDDYWTPTLEMAADAGLPLNFHLNAAIEPDNLVWKGLGFEETVSVVSNLYNIGNSATMGNWILSGRLDQFPKLKIGLIESGIGWVPFVLEAIEHKFNEMMAGKASRYGRRPKEYFRDQFWVSFWFEKAGPQQLLETIGVNKVMFETDFPHPAMLYPGVQDYLFEALGGYDYEVRKRVLERNAAELYNLPF
jgi:predicted TIM-barrel fold metal-dependent hydrolase